MRRALFMVAAVVAGGLIATSPYAEAEPCDVAPSEWSVPMGGEGWSSDRSSVRLWPPGTVCHYDAAGFTRTDVLGPDAVETLEVMIAVALLLAGWGRATAIPIGVLAVQAAATLAFGVLGGTSLLVLGAPVAFVATWAATRSPATAVEVVLVAVAVLGTWTLLWFFHGGVAVIAAFLAGVVTPYVLFHASGPFRRVFPANEFAPD
jgi:hypothetical protein